MMRSLFSAISGLGGSQQKMDVVANNIANVNTTAFKSGRVTFQDIISQTLRGAQAPTAAQGGLNPEQVGLGSAVGTIDMIMTQGNLQSTGIPTDVAIQGDGFFVLSQGPRDVTTPVNSFTRGNAFIVGDPRPVTHGPSGLQLLGYVGSVTVTPGSPPTAAVTTLPVVSPATRVPVSIPDTFGTPPDTVTVSGINVSASGVIDLTLSNGTTLNNYGQAAMTGTGDFILLGIQDLYTRDGNFTVSAPPPASVLRPLVNQNGLPIMGYTGSVLVTPGPTPTVSLAVPATAPGPDSVWTPPSQLMIPERFGTPPNTVEVTGFDIDQSGNLSLSLENGTTLAPFARIATALFDNPAALTRSGGNMFKASQNTGDPSFNGAGVNGRGSTQSGFLEMSNVDLAEQFTSMIIAQRGYQANSRTITASDQILEDLINTKR
jgi:flagellar hook protein FlgE